MEEEEESVPLYVYIQRLRKTVHRLSDAPAARGDIEHARAESAKSIGEIRKFLAAHAAGHTASEKSTLLWKRINAKLTLRDNVNAARDAVQRSVKGFSVVVSKPARKAIAAGLSVSRIVGHLHAFGREHGMEVETGVEDDEDMVTVTLFTDEVVVDVSVFGSGRVTCKIVAGAEAEDTIDLPACAEALVARHFTRVSAVLAAAISHANARVRAPAAAAAVAAECAAAAAAAAAAETAQAQAHAAATGAAVDGALWGGATVVPAASAAPFLCEAGAAAAAVAAGQRAPSPDSSAVPQRASVSAAACAAEVVAASRAAGVGPAAGVVSAPALFLLLSPSLLRPPAAGAPGGAAVGVHACSWPPGPLPPRVGAAVLSALRGETADGFSRSAFDRCVAAAVAGTLSTTVFAESAGGASGAEASVETARPVLLSSDGGDDGDGGVQAAGAGPARHSRAVLLAVGAAVAAGADARRRVSETSAATSAWPVSVPPLRIARARAGALMVAHSSVRASPDAAGWWLPIGASKERPSPLSVVLGSAPGSEGVRAARRLLRQHATVAHACMVCAPPAPGVDAPSVAGWAHAGEETDPAAGAAIALLGGRGAVPSASVECVVAGPGTVCALFTAREWSAPVGRAAAAEGGGGARRWVRSVAVVVATDGADGLQCTVVARRVGDAGGVVVCSGAEGRALWHKACGSPVVIACAVWCSADRGWWPAEAAGDEPQQKRVR